MRLDAKAHTVKISRITRFNKTSQIDRPSFIHFLANKRGRYAIEYTFSEGILANHFVLHCGKILKGYCKMFVKVVESQGNVTT